MREHLDKTELFGSVIFCSFKLLQFRCSGYACKEYCKVCQK